MIYTQPCYQLEYRHKPGLLFVWVDTLQGTFFGFATPTVYRGTNEWIEAYKDLEKTLKSQYRGLFGIGRYWGVIRYPNKEIPLLTNP